MFENLNIVIGITGGIAAYKVCGMDIKLLNHLLDILPVVMMQKENCLKNEEIIDYVKVVVKEKQ